MTPKTPSPLSVRIDRARTLARDHAASAELLTFYAALAECQQSLLRELLHVVRATADARFRDALNATAASALVSDVLGWLAAQSQPGLASAAHALTSRDHADWRPLLESCWHRGGAIDDHADDVEQFVVETLLQPFAESLATMHKDAETADRPDTSAGVDEPLTCPICAGLPVVATLREHGHGARRSLVCGFCLTEWPMPRIVCPACGENDFDALFVYRAEEFPASRIDACDSCDTYIKTIDVTVDGAALHIVDDLATLPTDLWAADKGYRKLRPNLLRL